MRLSAPIFRLRRRARLLAREARIPLHAALDRVARDEGFASWSLLVAKVPRRSAGHALLRGLSEGDMVLLAARPGHGKTMLGLDLLAEAVGAGRRGVFFTLECTAADLAAPLKAAGFEFDDSDEIDAARIIGRLAAAPRGTVAVVDYLQLLDQRRETPPLMTQIRDLRRAARGQGIVMVFLAQVHRSFEISGRPRPGLGDVRLPNPLDLGLFDKAVFLHDGDMRLERVA